MTNNAAYAEDGLSHNNIQPTEAFITPDWQGQLQQIVHLAEFTGDIQVIQGPEQSGKTTFLNLLAKKLPYDEYVGCLSAAEGILPDVALSKLLDCLGVSTVPGQQRGQSVVALRKYVSSLHSSQQRKILIIDDAHYLDDSVLASVASVMQGGLEQGFGLHLILFSEDGVAERFDGLGFIDISVHDSEMLPFSVKQTGQFIQSLFQDDPKLDDISSTEVNQVWNESKGLPGKILESINKASFLHEESPVESIRKVPWVHIAIVAILAGLLIWVVSQKSHDFANVNVIINSFKKMIIGEKNVGELSNEQKGFELPNERENKNLETKDQSSTLDLNQQDPEPSLGDASASDKPEELIATQKNEQAIVEPVDKVEEAAAPSDEESNKHNTVSEPESKALNENDIVFVESVEEKRDSLSETVDISEKAIEMPKAVEPAEKKIIETPKVADNEVKVKAQIAEARDIQAKSKPVPKTVDRLSTKEAFVADSEKKLLAMDPNGFVLQVLAAKPETPLLKYLREQSNEKDLMMYRGLRRGKQWFVVVEGFYETKDKATQAISSLPLEQVRAGPWPKQVKAVQLEIRASRQQ